MKKATVIALAAVLSVGMMTACAACGGGGDGGDTAETKTVKVWLHKSQTEEEGRTYKALEDLFNEADYKTEDGRDIVMKIEYKSNADQLRKAISSENSMGGEGLPDVIAIDSPDIAFYADNGTIVAIDDYISAETKGDYVDSVIEQSTIGGKLYALSGADAPAGLYYNKTLLSEAGITPGTAEDPWSWKDLADAITELKAAGKPYKIQLSLGFGGNEGLMYLHAPLIYSAGGTFADETGKVKASLTSEKALSGLDMLTQFVVEGKAKVAQADTWLYTGTNENAFPAGEIAFQIFGPWLTRTISKNYKGFENSYDVMPYPVYEDANGTKGDVATPCGSWGFSVTKAARDKDAAAQVVAYLTGAEASELLYDSVGTFPTHKSVLASAEDFGSGALKSLADLLTDTAVARPKLVNYSKLRDAYAKIIDYIHSHAGETQFNLKNYIEQEADGVDR